MLQRIDLATGVVENLTTSVFAPAAIALEEGGASALLADAAKLSRVDLVTGTVSTVATTTTADCGDFAGSLALEAAGTLLALTQDGCLMRVKLADGSGARVSCQYGGSAFFVALEAGGTTALMLEAGFTSYSAELVRVQLDTGARMAIATFDDYYTSGVTIEPGGTTALVISHGTDLLRVALSNGTVTPVTQLLIGSSGTVIASGFANLSTYNCGVGGLALEADGSHVLVADKGNGLKRVLLPPK